MTDCKILEEACIEAVKAGGFVARGFFQKEFKVMQKGERFDTNGIVTEADIAVEKAVREIISKKFPSHSIIGEENGGSAENEYCWFIDPIDGTMDFAHGWNNYGVMVGVALKNKPIAGAICMPEQNRLLHASIGNGAFENNRPLKTSSREMKKAIAILGFPVYSDYQSLIAKKFSNSTSGIRNVGSAAEAAALLAEGHTDITIGLGWDSWDSCAAAIIIREAGGLVLNLSANEWTTLDKDVIALANAGLKKETMEIINSKPTPKVGVGVLIRKDGKVLFGRSKREGRPWMPPGGKPELNETIFDCARRETREEAGIEIKNLRIMTCTDDITEKDHWITVSVVADYANGEPKVLEPDKNENWLWVDWNDLPRPLFISMENLKKKGFDPFRDCK